MKNFSVSNEINATREIMERVQSSPDELSVVIPAVNDALYPGPQTDVQWAHFGLTPNIVFSIFNGLSVIESVKNCESVLLSIDTLPEWNVEDIDLENEGLEVSKEGVRFVGSDPHSGQRVCTASFTCTDILQAIEQMAPGESICHIRFNDHETADEIVAGLNETYFLKNREVEPQYAAPRG